MQRKKIIRRFVVECLAVLCMLVAFGVSARADVHINEEVPADWHERNILRLTQFKIGANDGMLLEVGGKTMLIDGGTKGFHDEIMGALTARGITRLDCIFNTHPHDDHIDSQYRMIKNDGLTTDLFLSAFPQDYRDANQRKMVLLLEEKGIAFQRVADGDTMTFGGAEITFIQAPVGDLNARSCMMNVRFGEESSMLLTADVSGQVQHYFVAEVAPELLDVDVLKMPHHGLVHMVPDFVEKVSPQFVFITNKRSATPNTNAQMEKRQIAYLHSALGTIVMETDGIDWYIFQEKMKF